jgi:small subunit ribosomal protein S21
VGQATGAPQADGRRGAGSARLVCSLGERKTATLRVLRLGRLPRCVAYRQISHGREPYEGGEYPTVSEVKVREGETFESALRRFNKKIKQNGILSEVRRREHYEKPSVRRKRKLVAAKKRRLKAG